MKYDKPRNPAGRPKGSGMYGEPTRTMRVPVSKVERVRELVLMRGKKLPVYVAGNLSTELPEPCEGSPKVEMA